MYHPSPVGVPSEGLGASGAPSSVRINIISTASPSSPSVLTAYKATVPQAIVAAVAVLAPEAIPTDTYTSSPFDEIEGTFLCHWLLLLVGTVRVLVTKL